MTVPSDYAVIDRFAKVCGATKEEATDLLRSWALATNSAERTASEPAPAQPTWRRKLFLLGLALAVATYLARRTSPRLAGSVIKF